MLKTEVRGTSPDGNFTLDLFIKRYNSDLANDLGNLLQRTLTMVGRFCDGQLLLPYDLLGLRPWFTAKYGKRYANLGEQIGNSP